MPKPNYCGRCKHWHKRDEQTYSIDIGDCDKIPQGTKFTDDGNEYTYDGYSFEDELYDECMHCFEPKDGNTTYWYGIYDSAYICKKCESSMQMNVDGECVSEYFKYCPFCGRKITAFYASELDAEWLEEEKNG